jgi:hypothetical protein
MNPIPVPRGLSMAEKLDLLGHLNAQKLAAIQTLTQHALETEWAVVGLTAKGLEKLRRLLPAWEGGR